MWEWSTQKQDYHEARPTGVFLKKKKVVIMNRYSNFLSSRFVLGVMLGSMEYRNESELTIPFPLTRCVRVCWEWWMWGEIRQSWKQMVLQSTISITIAALTKLLLCNSYLWYNIQDTA